MAKRKTTKTKNKLFALGLIVIGSIFVVLSTFHSILRLRSLSLDKQVVATYQEQAPQAQRPPVPVHIYSQYFLDVDIDGQVYQDGKWTISDSHAAYLLSSARPGEQGNIILYGHNTRSILGNIRAYKGGEKITLTLADGSTRDYRVIRTYQVDPGNTSYLMPSSQETLTLYTCAGLMDSERFIVQAKPI